ncbi:polysaccharide pyruvyl transferase family protein [Pseudoalteromonas luteoviolacea]|uniref:polysaccharide pyruvyl transferase family protein n=1 Tax=Pseudoalteromonas luteoviolacea TaxID=43657 RepID=UPI00068C154F|nr:polysaccharide pyruvyl transferase family protein [Pseudoalteromonas luteoviolacea]
MKISSLYKIVSSNLKTIVSYHYSILKYKRENCILVNYFKGVPNWGDDLNQYLIEKVSGKKLVIYPYSKRKHVLGIGSILHRARDNSSVWGSGFISKDSGTKSKLDVFLLRGPLTAEKLGFKDVPYGDPGVCIRKYYSPKPTKKYKYGLIPHHVDKGNSVVKAWASRKDTLFIDIQQDIEPFIDQLLSCETIISSSLHGLIASDSYSIPNTHVVFSDKLLGGCFKFDDYSLGVSGKKRKPIYIKEGQDIESLETSFYYNEISDSKIEQILSLFPRT